MRARVVMGAGVITNAMATIVPQVAALLLLTPAEYATFSVVFIALGLTFSAQISFVIDPWLREGAPSTAVPAGPLVWSAVVLAAVASLIPLALGYVDAAGAVLVVAGLLASQLRNGLRLVEVAGRQWRRAHLSDLLLLVGFGAGLALLWDETAWTAIWVPLALGSLLAVAPSLRLLKSGDHNTLTWFARRRRTIAGLWAESAVLDLGVALPPLVLARLMMPAQFAVVRAASSALLPVRLVLNPMRSWIALQDPSIAAGRRFVLGSLLGGGVVGGAIWLGLELIGWLSIAPETVLPALIPYAPLVAVMATLQFMSNCVYILARAHVSPRGLLRPRLVDTSMQIVIVLGGFVLAGLDGAIVGYVLISAASYGIWLLVVRRALPAPAH